MAIQSINPYNGAILNEYEEFTPEQLEKMIATAHETFQWWQNEPVEKRANYLGKVADILEQRKNEIAKLITEEMGKLISDSLMEVNLVITIFEYYAKNASKFLAPKPIESSWGKAYINYEPQGVILGIEPWNYPFYQMARMAAPNVVAGNTVVLKQASNVSGCAVAFEKLFIDAGVPEGVYQSFVLSGSKTSPLLNDPRIVGASLTGSEKAGASLAEIAAKNLKKTVLELGGSDALIVLDNIEIDKAVEIAFVARMENMGQMCVSSKRIIIHEKIAEQFIQRFINKLNTLQAGDPLDESTTLAPINTEGAMNDLLDQVQRAVENGATLLQGGKKLDRPGFFMQPAVITNLTPDNPLFYEEMFGPIVVFHIAKDDEEAIKIANDSHYGLGGSIISSDIKRAEQVASKIKTGMVFINTPTLSAPELPFGGIKRSGYGHELSDEGIMEFVNKKLINVRETMDFADAFTVKF